MYGMVLDCLAVAVNTCLAGKRSAQWVYLFMDIGTLLHECIDRQLVAFSVYHEE